jgi:5-methylcytosine-specific restriction enzyme subunit McrC
MNKLFEDFVTRLLADAFAGTGVAVHAQRRDRRLIVEEPLDRPYAAVIPDILLESLDAAGRRRVPVDAKYKLYDESKLDPTDVYQTFFYAYAYARPIDREFEQVRAFILYPASGGGSGTRLRVLEQTGATTARIQAIPIDVPAALTAVRRGAAAELPALQPLLVDAERVATRDAA